MSHSKTEDLFFFYRIEIVSDGLSPKIHAVLNCSFHKKIFQKYFSILK